MLREISFYVFQCIALGARSASRGAFNLAPIFGAGLLGAILQYRGEEMIFSAGLWGVVASGIVYTAIAWGALFLVYAVFIIPFQLRSRNNRTDTRKQLQQFYIDGGTFLNTNLPNDISEDDFKIYEAAAVQWINNTYSWIMEHLGPAASDKFLDRSGLSMVYDKMVNSRHNEILNVVIKSRKNLSTLIETGAWDNRK